MVETTYHIPGAPRLALLSDLHGRPYSRVISSVAACRPDLIAITGDLTYCRWPENNQSPLETQENVLSFLSACASLAPTFVSLGNHEQALDEEDLQTISATGVTVLDNEWREIEVDGKEIIIGGLTNAYVTDYRKAVEGIRSDRNRYPKKESIEGLKGITTASQRLPETAWLQSFAAVPGYHILLSHHPEYFPLVPPSVDLILSGHAHGGQWRIFGRGVFAPGQGFWPRWTRGVYEGKLVVSAGLANTASVPRFFNPTEVVFIEPG